MSGQRVPRQGYPILCGGQPVGEVTSGTFSPTLKKPIAMGFVVPAAAKPGTELQVDVRGRAEPARVVELPFTNGTAAACDPYSKPSIIHTELPPTLKGAPANVARSQNTSIHKTHEWIHLEDGPGGVKTATVGVSDFAIQALTDLVHIELPEPGRSVQAGKPFGEVESVKAVSDLYSPVDGEVVEVEQGRGRRTSNRLTDDPYGAGWLVKIRVDDGGQSELLDYATYKKQCDEAEVIEGSGSRTCTDFEPFEACHPLADSPILAPCSQLPDSHALFPQ